MAGSADEFAADWGLQAYVARIAAGFGVGVGATCCEVADFATAYIALPDPAAGWPGRDAALVWDQQQGWALAVETHSGEDLLLLAYHGAPVLPVPEAVITFAKDSLADGTAAVTTRPLRFEPADLPAQLATYAGTPEAQPAASVPPGGADRDSSPVRDRPIRAGSRGVPESVAGAHSNVRTDVSRGAEVGTPISSSETVSPRREVGYATADAASAGAESA